VIASVFIAAPTAIAQEAMPSAVAIAAMCTPPADSSRAAHALRVAGSQDTVPRTIFGKGDLLVINGGTGAGVQLGAQFFVRRVSTTGQTYQMAGAHDVITDAWVQIVAVNDATSLASVQGLCGPIYVDDYLEPFATPQPIAAEQGPLDPDFANLGHVLSGADGHTLTAVDQIAILDRGAEQGLQPGSRFAIYRDLTAGVDPLLAAPAGTPLASIGEGVVLTATGNRAVVRIVRARDAVRAGDYVAPAKR
jgi:hypothetical protein